MIAAARTTLAGTVAGDGRGTCEREATETPRGGAISLMLANISWHMLDTSVSRLQQNRTSKGGWGNRSAPRTPPLTANGQS
jgi:hypothetical protein